MSFADRLRRAGERIAERAVRARRQALRDDLLLTKPQTLRGNRQAETRP